ncbi:response regulator transcription factor [Arthrobacter polaris]|uniref:response regulator transcription factor n=1 Tax=Arthrobacter polaris TaxID=2813727 RepID=UPI003D7DB997
MAWLRCVGKHSQQHVRATESHLSPCVGTGQNYGDGIPQSRTAGSRGLERSLRSLQRPAGGFLESAKSVNVRDGGPLQRCRQVWGEQLTERELEVAMLVVDGAPNRQVAAQLHVSVRTVEVHLGRVFAKLSVRSRVALSVLAHRMGSEWGQGGT